MQEIPKPFYSQTLQYYKNKISTQSLKQLTAGLFKVIPQFSVICRDMTSKIDPLGLFLYTYLRYSISYLICLGIHLFSLCKITSKLLKRGCLLSEAIAKYQKPQSVSMREAEMRSCSTHHTSHNGQPLGGSANHSHLKGHS